MLDDVRSMGKRMIDALPRIRPRVGRSINHLSGGAPSAREGIAVFRERWGDGEHVADSPIFILSAGWRGGASLLQRLVMSSGRAFLWGEPYHDCAYVQRMAESMRAFGGERPMDGAFHRPHANGRSQYDDARIAILFPEAPHLLAAHRAFFDRLLAAPAVDAGFERWGLKAVRFSTEQAHYLRWLYPNAKLLFQIRNPYKAYRVYRQSRGKYVLWPERPVVTPGDFGRVWRAIASGFVEEHEALGAMLVRFEELAAGERIGDIEEHVGLRVRRDILDRKLRERARPMQAIPPEELEALRQAVEPLALRLGYEATRG